jgi:hypothetical protein
MKQKPPVFTTRKHYALIKSLLILFVASIIFGCPPGQREATDNSLSYETLKAELFSAASEGDEPLASFIEKLLAQSEDKSGNWDASAFILAELDASLAKERLGYLSKHQSRPLRLLAAEALGIRADSESLELLAAMLKEVDESDRWSVFEAVAETGMREGEKVFDMALEQKSANPPALLKAIGNSRYRNLSRPLAESIVENWDGYYCEESFIDKIAAIRRLLDSSFIYKITKKNAAMETPEQIRYLGVAGDALSLKMLMDKASSIAQEKTLNPLAKPVFEALSIAPNEKAVVHLLLIRKNARNDGKIALMKVADHAIENSFRFNKHLILNGDDDFRFQSLKSILVFGMTDYKDKVLDILNTLKATKPKNPLVLDLMKNCYIFIEKQKKNNEKSLY